MRFCQIRLSRARQSPAGTSKSRLEWRDIDIKGLCCCKEELEDWISHVREDPAYEDKPAGGIVTDSFEKKPLPLDRELWVAREIEQYIMLLNRNPGVWSKRPPTLQHAVLAVIRSAAWGRKIAEWPVCATLMGPGKRDLARIGRLFDLLSARVADPAMCPPVEQWIRSTQVGETKFFQDQVQRGKRR